ncbi:cardiolipin synthase [Metabacillus sp. 84]
MVFFILILLLLLITVWMRIDFSLGYSRHVRKAGLQAYPLRKGGLHFFSDGQEFYADYFQAIRQASSSICASFFIIKNDEEISQTFLNLLGEKAQEGVRVFLMMDRIGAIKAPNRLLNKISSQGVEVIYSHKPKWPFLFFTIQARNHRKITVIDHHIGYLGGYNIGKEYIGKNPKLGYWRDYHLKITGAGIQDLAQQFRNDWRNAGGSYMERPKAVPAGKGEAAYRFVSSYGKSLDDQFLSFIHKAKKELIICTPYFIPGQKLHIELLQALERGVKIKIVVPMRSDHLLVKEAAFPYYGPLLKAGAEVYRFYLGFYHAKIIVCDDDFCDIGTANFDKRSMYLNDEMNALIYDREFTAQVKTSILKDIRNSEQLLYEDYMKRPLWQKTKEKAASVVSLFL